MGEERGRSQALSQLKNLEQRMGLIPNQFLVWKVLERNRKVLKPLEKQQKDVGFMGLNSDSAAGGLPGTAVCS